MTLLDSEHSQVAAHTVPRWTDGLSDAERARALDSARCIADAVRRIPSESLGAGSLAGGLGGITIFEAYLAMAGEANADQHCLAGLERVAQALEEDPNIPTLFEGSAGAAFALEHVRRRLLDDGPEMVEPFDEHLVAILDRHPVGTPWLGTFDLISGLAGVGVYGLERWPSDSGVRIVERVVRHLDATSEPREGGIAWWTPSSAVSETARASFGDHGYYNLGIAHGVPGVISFLASAVRLGVEPERSRRLLEGAVTWLRQWRETIGGPSRYPSWVYPDGRTQSARIAWCYGDPGVALALASAASALSDEGWRSEASEIACSAATVVQPAAGVSDAGLCHGAAGLAQIFGRLHQHLGGDDLAEAARRWLRMAFEMATPGQGVGDYQTWNRLPDGSDGWTDDPGLLMGSTGIGLVMLSAATRVEPEWDRMLLASWPEPG